MRLKTKLVVAAMAVTFGLVLVLSLLFLGELLHQRIDQTAADNEVLAHQVLLMARQAIETGLENNPPPNGSDAALRIAVREALRNYAPLADTMNAILRYSPTVQDVSVTEAHGVILASTNPDVLDQAAAGRMSLTSVRDGRPWQQLREVFGHPRVFDVALPLDRNGHPFVTIHVGVQSSFLRATFEPRLRTALLTALIAALLSMLGAALLATAALEPMQRIGEQLELLTRTAGGDGPAYARPTGSFGEDVDAVVRVNRTIDRLGMQIRTTEAEYTALQSNLDRMLDTLRDGVLLFTADRRAVMVSDAVANFLGTPVGDFRHDDMVGRRLEQIFPSDTPLGEAAERVFSRKPDADSGPAAETVTLQDGRRIQLSADRIRLGKDKRETGLVLTLRDTESAFKVEQELEVSRRLMAIGRLTAGVGHEVKNPINAMVLHLELLRSKLAATEDPAGQAARRHVEILTGEMQRLDRVVQTLADFTRPMELHLVEHDLCEIIQSVVELTSAEMTEHDVTVAFQPAMQQVCVRVDADLIRQAMLNLLLNGMQAMPEGGAIHVGLRREDQDAVLEIADEGEGIPPELLPRIFDLYFTTKPAGAGIGLATTYRILQMHGGTLDVRSSTDQNPHHAGRGTVFTLRLPIRQAQTSKTRRGSEAEAVERSTMAGGALVSVEGRR